MQKQHGLTLIELMVVLAISAILAFLAAPSFTSAIRSNAISSTVNTFLSDMRYARSEAIRLGGGVVLCRSDAPEDAAPACGTGHGPGNNGWVSGWFIFHDLDNDGALRCTERGNVEGMSIVAAVARRVDVSFVFLVGSRVEGFLVGLDVLYHHTEASLLLSVVIRLGLFPKRFVAGGAIGFDYCGVDLMSSDRVLDLGMTGHTFHLAVHALPILFGSDRMNGKDVFERSVLVRRCRISRDFGPATLKPHIDSVSERNTVEAGRGTARKKR